MNALALIIPRTAPSAAESGRSEEEEFHALVESIETLLFTSADRPDLLDRAVLATAMAELEARWPEAAVELRPRVEARGRHCA